MRRRRSATCDCALASRVATVASLLHVGRMASSSRAILHVDVDCFYVQVEMLRNPHLDKDRPVAVTQKFLCVTANYPARAAGVGKLMRIDVAKERCPDLVLISGEDLTPYREASATIFAALSSFGPCQKLGLDELFVDVTAKALERAEDDAWASGCHVHSAAHGTTSAEALEGRATNYRPQDLRAAAATTTTTAAAPEDADDSLPLLKRASHLAVQCKEAIRLQTGLTVSIGVATNKTLAKLTSGLHKPDGLTSLPSSQALAFLSPLDVRVLPGVGGAAAPRLRQIGVNTVADLADITPQRLQKALQGGVGSAASSSSSSSLTLTASRLHELSRGIDTEKVVQSGPPKSLSVEDSFKGVTTFEALTDVLRVLVPDLLQRLDSDRRAYSRRPKTLTIRYRHAGARTMNVPNGAISGLSAVRSTPMPHLSNSDAQEKVLIETSLRVLREALSTSSSSSSSASSSFCLTLLGLGATNFEPAMRSAVLTTTSPTASSHASPATAATAAAAEMQRNWRADYGGPAARTGVAAPNGGLVSKGEERRRREAGRGVVGTTATAAAGVDGDGDDEDDAMIEMADEWGEEDEEEDAAVEPVVEEVAAAAAPTSSSCVCPICGVSLPAEDNTQLNAHIDACLGEAPPAAPPPQAAAAAARPRANSNAGSKKRKANGKQPSPKGQRTLLSSWVTRGGGDT